MNVHQNSSTMHDAHWHASNLGVLGAVGAVSAPAEVVVGQGVTIGCGSCVLPGCHISDGASLGDVSLLMKVGPACG